MALINRIEVVNYLCEGWQPSMGIANWRPLWPANLIHLCGASTAIQVPNGCGKTSVTSAVLYLLSRNRELKQQFLDRCAPTGLTASHIRVEFAILTDEDLVQRDLMTADPRSLRAQTYVIGVCGNRGDDHPRFYRYPGLLEDVPVARLDGTTIGFVATEVLRAGVKAIRGGQWDNWDTIAEWSKVVGTFMSPDVVRQNVQFHREGAGDASAAFSKVTQGPSERFDEAYFRQVVAPQLLSNVMGDAAEEGERNIEDTILISMNRFIDAKLQVEGKRAYLERRGVLETEFRPVVEAGGKIQDADTEYQGQLQRLAVEAAFLARFTDAREGRMPGVPRQLDELPLPPEVRDCLKSMALDKDGSLLIESSGLAGLLGLSTGRLNELASRKFTTREAVSYIPATSQLIEFKRDIKVSEGGGGQRKALRYYDLIAALELTARASEDGSSQAAALEQAFEIAKTGVDTNLFRHVHNGLTARKDELKAGIRRAEEAGTAAERERERLERQVQDRQENQGAYEAFCAHLHLLPSDLRDSPLRVGDWLLAESEARTNAVSDHVERIGLLTPGWNEFRAVHDDLGLISIEDRILALQAERTGLETATQELRSDVLTAQSRLSKATKDAQRLQSEWSKVTGEHDRLSERAPAYERFLALFGDVDPLQVGPPSAEKQEIDRRKNQMDGQRRENARRLELIRSFAEGAAGFQQWFGDIAPHQATPQQDYDRLLQAQRAADARLAEHRPLAESLQLHLAQTSQAPDAWLDAADRARAQAQQRERAALEAVADIERDVSALDNLDLVGNADYAAVHEALAQAGIHASRIRDVILDLGRSRETVLPRLAAFGPLLDAPVVADMDAAETALEVLQAGGHDVPLLLRGPLVETLERGADHDTPTAAALQFLVGPKSRRLRALLDPQALAEEREALLRQRDLDATRAENAHALAETYSPNTVDYRRALQAMEAVRQGSVEAAQAAQKELTAIEVDIATVKLRVSPQALSVLANATKFIEAGGDDALVALATAVEAITDEIALLDDRLTAMAPLLTPEAIVAHGDARRFAQGGGHDVLHSLKEQQAVLQQQLSDIAEEIPALEASLAMLRSDLENAQTKERDFVTSLTTTLARFGRVKAFDAEGHAAFMEGHKERRAQLEFLRNALDPLRSINYAGAQAFRDHQGQDEATLRQLIADAVNRRQQAVAQAQELYRQVEHLEGESGLARQAAEALHELAHFLCARRKAVAPFEKDLASRESGASPAEAHAAYAMAQALRQRLQDWRPGDGAFDRAELGQLREEVEAIDVVQTGKEVLDARKRAERARNQFANVRDVFCKKARSSSDGGFSEAEIEIVEAANSARELERLASIGRRLQEQLHTEQSELEELQHATQTVEATSIETLTRLVETSRSNLVTMNSVMERNPKARFVIQADVISTEDIKKLIEDLRDHIEARKREAQSRQSLIRSTIDHRMGEDIRRALIDRIFTNPSVEFRHVGMWDGRQRPVQKSLSEGQKSALQMLWLIKESEYHLECAVRRHLGGGSKKKLRSRAQRVLFFDGLFSNLTDRALIDEAFKGLGEADSNLQLIGLIHNQEYRNNFAIFPSFVIGRRAGRRDVEGQRSYIRFEDGRPEGTMGMMTFMLKRPPAVTEVDVS